MPVPPSNGWGSTPSVTAVAIELFFDGRRYRSTAAVASDAAIPLAFDGGGPCAFGAQPAMLDPLVVGDFTGRMGTGATCNASVLHLAPHGNGTHTESVAHIADDGPPVPALLNGGWMPAWLVSVDAAGGPIEAAALEQALERSRAAGAVALLVRTRPNTTEKLTRQYPGEAMPPWFEVMAARAVAEAGIEHWLVDLPSLDRLDDTALPAHRAFFGLPAGARSARGARRRFCTVTEMIYVADELADGLYLLDLQVPRWSLEAVPSRPLLMQTELIDEQTMRDDGL